MLGNQGLERLRSQQRHVTRHHEHRVLGRHRQCSQPHGGGVAGTQLLGLQCRRHQRRQLVVGDRGGHRAGLVTDDDRNRSQREPRERLQRPVEQGTPERLVQHLGEVGAHTGAFARCEHDGV